VITDQHEVETQFNVALESQVLFSAFEWARNKDEWTENDLKNYFIALIPHVVPTCVSRTVAFIVKNIYNKILFACLVG